MITGTCGHHIPSLEGIKQTLVKDMLPNGTPAISMEVVCEECYKRLLGEDMLLLSMEDVDKYNKRLIKTRKR